MQAASAQVYEFGDFRLDAAKRLLRRRDGTMVPLTPRVFDTLLYMVEHHDTVLGKERLMEAVWPDSIVEENNLAQNISTLRHMFGEDPGSHRFIVTVPGRGYRFVADVKTQTEEAEPEKKPETAIELNHSKREAESVVPVLQPDSSAGKRDLRPVMLSALVVIALGVAGFFLWRTRPQSAAVLPPRASATNNTIPEKSIAVLPFENLTDDKQNSYFATGVQDEILSNLAKIADLKVISRTSASLYKSGNPRNSREIGQQLGVAHLLEGNVQRVRDRVRLNAQLIDARTDTHVWAQTYDRDVADVFAIQSEIAQSIAGQLQVKISPAERAAIAQPPTTDLTAKALYLQALDLEYKPPEHENLLKAVHLLEEAVARDPRFVLAYCAASWMHSYLYFGGWDHTPARRELARVAIENASRINPEAGEVHLARADYLYHGFMDYDRARAELDLARRTLTNEPKVYFMSATIDRRQGRWSEAVRNFERAVELDPRNMEFLLIGGGMYHYLRRYPEATRMLDRAVAVSPHDYFARIRRAFQPLDERADIRPLRAELNAILAEEPGAAEKIADALFSCATLERDSAATARALTAISSEGLGDDRNNFQSSREWFVGLAARTFGDGSKAHSAFTAARAIQEKAVRDQPAYAAAWSRLGVIDAGLGRKDDAVREGRRACELLPLSMDSVAGPSFVTNLAIIYAWTGDKDSALEQLAISAQVPFGVTYGDLKLNPQWDPLRGDPRFGKIVASLAPKDAAK